MSARRRYVPFTQRQPGERIAGELDWRRLADAHRPTDPIALAAEVRRLHGTGLTGQDISELLHIALPVVLELIQGPIK